VDEDGSSNVKDWEWKWRCELELGTPERKQVVDARKSAGRKKWKKKV